MKKRGRVMLSGVSVIALALFVFAKGVSVPFLQANVPLEQAFESWDGEKALSVFHGGEMVRAFWFLLLLLIGQVWFEGPKARLGLMICGVVVPLLIIEPVFAAAMLLAPLLIVLPLFSADGEFYGEELLAVGAVGMCMLACLTAAWIEAARLWLRSARAPVLPAQE